MDSLWARSLVAFSIRICMEGNGVKGFGVMVGWTTDIVVVRLDGFSVGIEVGMASGVQAVTQKMMKKNRICIAYVWNVGFFCVPRHDYTFYDK